MKIVVTHASEFSGKGELYKAIRESAFGKANDVFLPREKNKPERITKDLIEHCDLVIAEVSHPSTGQGIELGWADAFHRPVVCMYREGSITSDSLKFITDKFIPYQDIEEAIQRLEELIQEKK